MSKRKIPVWLLLIVLLPTLLIVFIGGLNLYVRATAKPLHPNAADVPVVTAPASSPAWAGAIERAHQVALAGLLEQNLPALSVAVGVDGELVWAESLGWADLENRVKVTPDTLFAIGMGSKVITSAAAGLLIEQGRLNLDDDIHTHVPAYPRKQWPITLRQLMAHTAGVRNDGGDEGPLSEHCNDTLEGLRLFDDDSLLFEPGTQYRYSNYGWVLVSAAVEAAAGTPFHTFVRRNVLEPIGMTNTRADAGPQSGTGRAAFYFPRFGADPKLGEDGKREVDYSCFSGSGGFLSTPSDLVRFGMAITNGKLLQPATVQTLQTSQRLPSGEETGYGLGWDLETITVGGQPTTVIGHDGEWMGGPVMTLMTLRDRGIVVAVTSNIGYADTPGLAAKLADVFATTPRK
jgi:CubicO group peptidase (beta-lactamase class C family)